MAPESQGRGAVRQPLGLWWLGVVGLVVAAVLLVTSNVRAFGYAVGVTPVQRLNARKKSLA